MDHFMYHFTNVTTKILTFDISPVEIYFIQVSTYTRFNSINQMYQIWFSENSQPNDQNSILFDVINSNLNAQDVIDVKYHWLPFREYPFHGYKIIDKFYIKITQSGGYKNFAINIIYKRCK